MTVCKIVEMLRNYTPGIIFIALNIISFSFFTFKIETWIPPATNEGEISASEQMGDFSCTFDNVLPTEIATGETDSTEWHGRFDLPDLPYIWEPAEPNERLSNFRNALRDRIGPEMDSRELTELQRNIFVSLPDNWSSEAANSTLLLEGRAGVITDMSCLEMMLWTWQDARYPMLEHPTEFGAFVMRGHGNIRVYLSSADLVGGRVNQQVTGLMQDDITAGYRLITHIHNHPFLFDREAGDRMWTIEATVNDIAGALAPSMSDVGFYRGFRKSHSLEQAWITNGLQSSRFQYSDFDILIAR